MMTLFPMTLMIRDVVPSMCHIVTAQTHIVTAQTVIVNFENSSSWLLVNSKQKPMF